MKQADQNTGTLYPTTCKCFLVFSAVFDVGWSYSVKVVFVAYGTSMMVFRRCIFSSSCHFRGEPGVSPLYSTTVLYDICIVHFEDSTLICSPFKLAAYIIQFFFLFF